MAEKRTYTKGENRIVYSKETQVIPSRHVRLDIPLNVTDEVIREVSTRFGEVNCVAAAEMEEDPASSSSSNSVRQVHVSFKYLNDAVKAVEGGFQVGDDECPWIAHYVAGKKLKRREPLPETVTCTSTTKDITVPGLHIIEEFLTAEEEDIVLREVAFHIQGSKSNTAERSSTSIKRRVQHFGWNFNYTTLDVDRDQAVTPIPNTCSILARRLVETGLVGSPPDQLTVNEYVPGTGIAPHVDNRRAFGDAIVSISLVSPCVMDFEEVSSIGSDESEVGKKGVKTKAVVLRPRSCVIMTNESRHHWTHGIAARARDLVEGEWMDRGRRVSLTFRNIVW